MAGAAQYALAKEVRVLCLGYFGFVRGILEKTDEFVIAVSDTTADLLANVRNDENDEEGDDDDLALGEVRKLIFTTEPRILKEALAGPGLNYDRKQLMKNMTLVSTGRLSSRQTFHPEEKH